VAATLTSPVTRDRGPLQGVRVGLDFPAWVEWLAVLEAVVAVAVAVKGLPSKTGSNTRTLRSSDSNFWDSTLPVLLVVGMQVATMEIVTTAEQFPC